MNRYLLDTNILEWLSDRAHPCHVPCKQGLASLKDDDEVFIPMPAVYEMQYGIANFPAHADDLKRKARQAFDSYVAHFQLANLSLSGAAIFGSLKSRYQAASSVSRNNLRKSSFDLLIASISIDHNAILVSNDAFFQTLAALEPRFQTLDWTI